MPLSRDPVLISDPDNKARSLVITGLSHYLEKSTVCFFQDNNINKPVITSKQASLSRDNY